MNIELLINNNGIVKDSTGGLFNLQRGNVVLSDPSVKKWDTKQGRAIQIARYRRLVYKPVINWCDNRGITNKKSIRILLMLKAHGKFDEVAIGLDTDLSYSLDAITVLVNQLLL